MWSAIPLMEIYILTVDFLKEVKDEKIFAIFNLVVIFSTFFNWVCRGIVYESSA